MALNVYFNTGTVDQELGISGVEFTEFSQGNDQFIISAGSDVVKDGEPIPSQSELISAGIQTGGEIIVDKYFLADVSVNLLKEISLMGNQNARYVLALDFDNSTASEPVLEIWDDSNLNTIDSVFLGSGVPSNSFIRGITTTNSAPGTNWIVGADRLAGSSSGHFLYLNNQNGPLSVADTLYANLTVVIPASQTIGFSANPVYVVKWLSN